MGARIYPLTFAVLLTVLSPLRASSQFYIYAPFLDQSQTTVSHIDRVAQNLSLAQTFTPSTSGYLGEIGLWAGRLDANDSTPFLVSLAGTRNGLPDQLLRTLDQTYFNPGPGSGYLYDFSSDRIFLNAGTQYAIVLACPGSLAGIGVGASASDLYARGQELERIGSGQWGGTDFPVTGNAGADLEFQTFMVPEPGVTALTAFGLSTLFLLRRGVKIFLSHK